MSCATAPIMAAVPRRVPLLAAGTTCRRQAAHRAHVLASRRANVAPFHLPFPCPFAALPLPSTAISTQQRNRTLWWQQIGVRPAAHLGDLGRQKDGADQLEAEACRHVGGLLQRQPPGRQQLHRLGLLAAAHWVQGRWVHARTARCAKPRLSGQPSASQLPASYQPATSRPPLTRTAGTRALMARSARVARSSVHSGSSPCYRMEDAAGATGRVCMPLRACCRLRPGLAGLAMAAL